MDSVSNETLAEAIQAIESGVGFNAAVARYPAEAAGLRSHLGLWQRLEAAPRVDMANSAANGGRASVLEVLAGPPGAAFKGAQSAFAKAAAVAMGVMVLGASAAGASAALGGPDFAGAALESVGIHRGGEAGDSEDVSTDIDEGTTPDGSTENTHPNENADENAFEACRNRDDGAGNADESADNGAANADPRALEGGKGEGGQCEEEHGNGQGQPEDVGQGNGDANGQGNGQPTVPGANSNSSGAPEPNGGGPKD